MSLLDRLDPASRELLERFGFDEERFERLRRLVAEGTLSPAANVVSGQVEPPAPEDLVPAPENGEAVEAGLEAIRAGEVAQIVLAGGMATRFGGVVKGTVEAVGGRSFLDWKLGETARLGHALGAEVPVALMTSFATEETTKAHVETLDVPAPLRFTQFVAPRLTPEGELFLDDTGAASLHGPGHGDLFEAVQWSGVLDRLVALGVKVVQVSNVDNLGARVDPAVIGAHVLASAQMTVEVARKEGDAGGAPARVDGRLTLLESPRFPPGFDAAAIPVFNTNTTTFDVEVLAGEYELTWLHVTKEVAGRPAVQLERLYHEVASFVDAQFLVVPRSGPRGRFFPIKTPDDLVTRAGDLREMLATPLV